MLTRRNFFMAAGLTTAGALANAPQILQVAPKAKSELTPESASLQEKLAIACSAPSWISNNLLSLVITKTS